MAKLSDLAKLAATAKKISDVKSAISSTKSKKSTSALDLSSLAKGIISSSKSSSTDSASLIKTLAASFTGSKQAEPSMIENASTLFKTLLGNKTEESENPDKTQLKNEITILQHILPSTLTKGNLETIIKKIIASLIPSKRNESSVISVLKGFSGVDMNLAKTIISKLLG